MQEAGSALGGLAGFSAVAVPVGIATQGLGLAPLAAGAIGAGVAGAAPPGTFKRRVASGATMAAGSAALGGVAPRVAAAVGGGLAGRATGAVGGAATFGVAQPLAQHAALSAMGEQEPAPGLREMAHGGANLLALNLLMEGVGHLRGRGAVKPNPTPADAQAAQENITPPAGLPDNLRPVVDEASANLGQWVADTQAKNPRGFRYGGLQIDDAHVIPNLTRVFPGDAKPVRVTVYDEATGNLHSVALESPGALAEAMRNRPQMAESEQPPPAPKPGMPAKRTPEQYAAHEEMGARAAALEAQAPKAIAALERQIAERPGDKNVGRWKRRLEKWKNLDVGAGQPALPETAPAVSRTPEPGPKPPRPIPATGLPSYLHDDIKQGVEVANRVGVADEIENLSAQSLTANEVVKKIEGKFKGMTPAEIRGVVRAVRADRGIPSMDTSDFKEWLAARKPAEPGQPERGLGTSPPQVAPKGPKAPLVPITVKYAERPRSSGVEPTAPPKPATVPQARAETSEPVAAPGKVEQAKPRAPAAPEAPPAEKKVVHWKGSKAEITGPKVTLHGGEFYPAKIVGGHRHGDKIHVAARLVEGTEAPKATAKKPVTPQVEKAKPPKTAPAEVEPIARGRATTIKTSGQSHPAEYQEVHLKDLQTSHNPMNFEPNPRYPFEQQRNYTEDKNEQLKVIRGSQNFDPLEYFTDTPGPTDGPSMTSGPNAVGGNGRLMMIKRGLEQGTIKPEDLQKWVQEAGPKFGIEGAGKEPGTIIVRRLTSKMTEAEQQKTTKALNEGKQNAVEPVSDAIARSRNLSPETTDWVASHLEEAGSDATVSSAVFGSARKLSELFKRLVDDKVITEAEMSRFTDGEGLTPEGKRMIESVLLGRVIRSSKMVRGLAASEKNIVLGALPELIRGETFTPGWKANKPLMAGLWLYHEARAAGEPVSYYLEKPRLIEDEFVSKVANDPAAIAFAEWFEKNPKVRDLRDALRTYNGRASEGSSEERGQGGMFGGTEAQHETVNRAFGTKLTADDFARSGSLTKESRQDAIENIVGDALGVDKGPVTGARQNPGDRARRAAARLAFRKVARLAAKDKTVEALANREPLDESGAVKRVIEAIEKAKPLLPEQAKKYTAERTKRIQQSRRAETGLSGEAQLQTRMRSMKGEYPKVEFESIRKALSQDNVDDLVKMIVKHPALTFFEQMRAFVGLRKILGEEGGALPQKNELELLEIIYGEDFVKALGKIRPQVMGWKEIGYAIANTSRSLRTSLDLSAPLRQGVFLAASHPKEWASAFMAMHRFWKSEADFRESMESIYHDPVYKMARRGELSITRRGSSVLEGQEEVFLGAHYAEYVPGVKASERAYVGFLNKLRFDVFKALVSLAHANGHTLTGEAGTARLKEIAAFVNAATGRGDSKFITKHVQGLNALFFAPRLIASRLHMLNPRYYVSGDPFVRKQYLKSMAAFAGSAALVATLAGWAGGEVEKRRANADWMKVRVGGVTYDFLGGFAQYLRLLPELTSAAYNQARGRRLRYGTSGEILGRFLKNKLAPIPDFTLKALNATRHGGAKQKFELGKELVNLFVPMIAQDFFEVMKEDPRQAPGAIAASAYGVSVGAYPKPRK